MLDSVSDFGGICEEVEVCVGLGSWQSIPIASAEGWSRMGVAYHVGANVECTSGQPKSRSQMGTF